MIIRRVTIVSMAKPPEQSMNEELQWFGQALGLFGERDKDKSCFRIFIELVKAAKRQEGLSSDSLASRLNLTRGTVVHHLNTLIEKGIIRHLGNHYILRSGNLVQLMQDIHRDVDRTMNRLTQVAEELDRLLEL